MSPLLGWSSNKILKKISATFISILIFFNITVTFLLIAYIFVIPYHWRSEIQAVIQGRDMHFQYNSFPISSDIRCFFRKGILALPSSRTQGQTGHFHINLDEETYKKFEILPGVYKCEASWKRTISEEVFRNTFLINKS